MLTRWWPARSRAMSWSPGRGEWLRSSRRRSNPSCQEELASASTMIWSPAMTRGSGRRRSRVRQLDHHGDFAELNDVARVQLPLAGAEADAVDVGAVGAFQVADPPAGVGLADLGVAAADGAVVQHDLQGAEPAGPENVRGLPRLSFDLAADSFEANRGRPCLPASLASRPIPGRAAGRGVVPPRAVERGRTLSNLVHSSSRFKTNLCSGTIRAGA